MRLRDYIGETIAAIAIIFILPGAFLFLAIGFGVTQ